MKKLLFLLVVVLMMTGCVVYPGGYYGYNDSGYYGYPYGYINPSVNLQFYGGHGFYRGGYGFHHGGYRGGWHR